MSRGEGRTRLFLPALGGSFELYERLVDALAERSRVVVVEPLGAGGSDPPHGFPTTQDLAEGVVAALDPLGLTDFDLVGLSLGGMIAQWVAGSVPERVRTLVLASTAVRGLRGALAGDLRNAAMARFLLEPDAEEANLSLAEDLLEDRASPSLEARVEKAIEAHPASRATLVRLGAAAARHDGREPLARYRGPALVLSGALDTILPPPAQADLLEHLAAGRQVIVDGVGHDLGLEAPGLMARACDGLVGDSP